MEKYINESMKLVCAEIEAQESWEDEQFMQDLDCQYDDDPFAGMFCDHCGDPVEEGHDCQ